MARLLWSSSFTRCNIWAKISEEWFVFRLGLYSLFYNSLTSFGTVVDTAMEPLFWCVDHFVRYLGPLFALLSPHCFQFFVVIVIVATTSVVIIFYLCLLPHKLRESYWWTAYHLVVGHWLLANIAFHYYRAAFTDPGYPPNKIPETVGICKKCVSPKPPRSHHCSICGRCVLKMDHHCPWVNNCVGHNNHRYFFLYCAYMCVGCIYVSVSAYPLFVQHFYGNVTEEVGWAGLLRPLYRAKEMLTYLFTSSSNDSNLSSVSPTRSTSGFFFHSLIIYEFMLCSAAAVALGALLAWHARLIHYAETSIEVHTNRVESHRLLKLDVIYQNPYSFGPGRNWRIFLGLTHGRSFWRHVLLPSSHAPDGDGLTWKTIYRERENPEGILLL